MSKLLGVLTAAAFVAMSSAAMAQNLMPCPANAPPGACSGEAQYPSLSTESNPQAEQSAGVVGQAEQPFSYGGSPYGSISSYSSWAQ